MKRQVRNALSELLLKALHDPEKVPIVQWLYTLLIPSSSEIERALPEDLKDLQPLGLFRIRDGTLSPLPELQADLPALKEKVEAYLRVLSRTGPGGERGLKEGLYKAALLFNEGLYFECHELLEGYWMAEKEEKRRRLLKGLIQIAAAFYHLSNGNDRGALSLLRAGLPKVKSFGPSFLNLDLEGFLGGVERCLHTLTRDPRSFDPALIPKMDIVNR